MARAKDFYVKDGWGEKDQETFAMLLEAAFCLRTLTGRGHSVDPGAIESTVRMAESAQLEAEAALASSDVPTGLKFAASEFIEAHSNFNDGESQRAVGGEIALEQFIPAEYYKIIIGAFCLKYAAEKLRNDYSNVDVEEIKAAMEPYRILAEGILDEMGRQEKPTNAFDSDVRDFVRTEFLGSLAALRRAAKKIDINFHVDFDVLAKVIGERRE